MAAVFELIREQPHRFDIFCLGLSGRVGASEISLGWKTPRHNPKFMDNKDL